MAQKVLYLPGILGSQLGWSEGAGGALHPCWLDLPAVVAGDLASLQLAADGVSPGPLAQGRSVAVTGLLPSVYEPLAVFLRTVGYDVLPLPFDWRLSGFTLGQVLAPVVRAWAAGQPFWVVAHSQGGLVARALLYQMQQGGWAAQMAGYIGLGVPHYGSMEPVRLWFRLPLLYEALAAATAAALTWPEGAGPLYLDAVLATMPSWYELMAFAADGPLFKQYPCQAAAIYQPATYAGINGFVNPNAFTQAQIVQTVLGPILPATNFYSIAGFGTATPFAFRPFGNPARVDGWQYTTEGDGSVTVAQASPPGATVIRLLVSHGLLPVSPQVWGAVLALLPKP